MQGGGLREGRHHHRPEGPAGGPLRHRGRHATRPDEGAQAQARGRRRDEVEGRLAAHASAPSALGAAAVPLGARRGGDACPSPRRPQASALPRAAPAGAGVGAARRNADENLARRGDAVHRSAPSPRDEEALLRRFSDGEIQYLLRRLDRRVGPLLRPGRGQGVRQAARATRTRSSTCPTRSTSSRTTSARGSTCASCSRWTPRSTTARRSRATWRSPAG